MGTVTLAFVGDIMLGRGVTEELARRPPEWPLGDTAPILCGAAAVIGNLECAVTQRTRPWAPPKVFHFRADPAAAAVLRAANVRCVSLANNHALDFGRDGLLETLEVLRRAGIGWAGAGRDAVEAAAPAVFDAAGIAVGVVAFTDNEPPFAAGPDLPGTNYLRIDTGRSTLERVGGSLAEARSRGARLVVLSLHWGPNMRSAPPEAFRDFAHAAVALGADVVHGHSAHVFQAVEVHRGRSILYDTGDFLDDYAVDPVLRNDRSFVFLLEIEDGRPRRLRMVPVRLGYARVQLARGEEFEAIRRSMVERCAGFATALRETDEGLAVDLEPDQRAAGGPTSAADCRSSATTRSSVTSPKSR